MLVLESVRVTELVVGTTDTHHGAKLARNQETCKLWREKIQAIAD
jgi:hypothetical protein